MNSAHRLDASPSGKGTVLAAWERFVRGEDQVPGVRAEVAISWHRCREQYRVDPHLTAAPVAVAEIDHTLEHDVVLAELGFRAASIAHEVSNPAEPSGEFNAIDARNGELLWQFQCGSGHHSSPVTYMVDGRQYIAVPVGWGGWIEGFLPGMLGAGHGSALIVFALPE